MPSMGDHALLLVIGVFGLKGIEVGGQWHFRINDHYALVRQAYDHIWALTLSVTRFNRGLFLKIAVVNHAGHFDRAAKLHFSPLPTDLRCAQCLHKTARGLTELNLRLRELLELLLERSIGLRAALFDFFDAFVESLQCNTHRLDGFINRLLAFV